MLQTIGAPHAMVSNIMLHHMDVSDAMMSDSMQHDAQLCETLRNNSMLQNNRDQSAALSAACND